MTKKVDEFEKYCSKLDDETFNNACLIFGIISDISLEDLEKSLEQEANKQKAKANQKRRNNKKKEEEEEEEVATPISGTTGPRMSIYTEEELREMEEEESRESEEEEEDVDYDEYDDYYDDEN